MVEPVITNLEIPDHDGGIISLDMPKVWPDDSLIAEEELEPLDSPPPSYIILCCEWMAMKMCGYSPLDKEEINTDVGKKKFNIWIIIRCHEKRTMALSWRDYDF